MGSGDPFVISKAIAASDPNLQKLVRERIDRGERLVEVFSQPGLPEGEGKYQVFFQFEPAASVVHIVDSGFLVFVDMPARRAIGVVDPYVLHRERRHVNPG